MSYWFEFPELFVTIVDFPTPKERMLAVLKWYITGLSREYASRNKNVRLYKILSCNVNQNFSMVLKRNR